MQSVKAGILLGLGMGLVVAAFLLWVGESVLPPRTPPRPAAAAPAGRAASLPALNAPALSGPAPTPAPALVRVTIEPDRTAREIGEALLAAGIVRSIDDFLMEVRRQDASTRLRPGEYRFERNAPTAKVVETLIKG